MLLDDKNAVIYGAAGAIGSAIARKFAREGANVFLAGRTMAPLDAVAKEIVATGGVAETARLDALDEQAVDKHAGTVVEEGGSIDISVNAVGVDHVQGTPLAELAPEEYALPIATYTRSNFLTATAAARHMLDSESGVILTLSTPGSRLAAAGAGGMAAACAAVEAFSRQLAAELGPRGVRVVCLRPDAIPEAARLGSHSRTVFARAAERRHVTLEDLLTGFGHGNLMHRAVTLGEVADVAAFMASDHASAMTATVANISCGSVAD